MAPAERFLAPVAVLGLHLLLLLDVVSHSKRLRDGHHHPLAAFEWSVALAALLTYLRTVISDPGFLSLKPSKPSRLWLVISSAIGSLILVGTLGLAALWKRGAESAAGINGSGGAVSGRDRRDAHEARELQPIGRSTLEAVGTSEVGSDPGEETIHAADLESAVPPPVALGHTPPKEGNSLGAIPGSPRPGANRNRGKRGERFGGRWVDAGDPGGDTHGRVMTQSGHRLRYCRICSMYQPLRTKHCRDCGQCVRTHDHHCPWVGTCVGEGNRVFFFWFLVAQFLELLVFTWEGVHTLLEGGVNLAVWLNQTPGLVLGLAFMALLLFMVSCLLFFHSFLALTNMTTWENMSWHNISYLRSLPPEDGSPFSQSLCANLVAYCCPPWCVCQACAGPDPLKRTEDGWAVWELGDAHTPLHVKCEICGMRAGCIFCHCFSAG